MIVPYVWWLSHYDNHAHAFPLGQAADRTRRYFEAKCTHSVPTEALTRSMPGDRPPCLRCVLAVGSTLPDPGEGGHARSPMSALRTSAAIS